MSLEYFSLSHLYKHSNAETVWERIALCFMLETLVSHNLFTKYKIKGSISFKTA